MPSSTIDTLTIQVANGKKHGCAGSVRKEGKKEDTELEEIETSFACASAPQSFHDPDRSYTVSCFQS